MHMTVKGQLEQRQQLGQQERKKSDSKTWATSASKSCWNSSAKTARKGSFDSRLCILWMGEQVKANTLGCPHVRHTELLPTWGKQWRQCWGRREGPIHQERGTTHDGPREEPVKNSSKEESGQKTWGEGQPLHLAPQAQFQGQTRGNSCHLGKTFQSQKEKGIQPQLNSQKLSVN